LCLETVISLYLVS